jgi:glycosyltransferase involved in cell wall biosynthesis
VVYTGKLLMPEVRLMLDAAGALEKMMPTARMIFAGGNPAVLAECNDEVARRKLTNVQFAGFVPPARIALYQKAADVLMLYLVSDRDIINYITPSKIFDYLQAGRPIVVSDYPILHEILEHNRNALLVKPHDPLHLAAEISRVLSQPELSARLSKAAEADSKFYSWSTGQSRFGNS